MGASTNLVPISIIYTSIIVYLFFYKISPKIVNPNIPKIAILIGLLFISHSLYASGISIYSPYSQCGKYSILNAIKNSFIMFIWLLVPIIILFFTKLFSQPFYNIWGYNVKSDTIIYSFFLSLITILVSIMIYYNSQEDVCIADANYIAENVKQLDKIFNEDDNNKGNDNSK